MGMMDNTIVSGIGMRVHQKEKHEEISKLEEETLEQKNSFQSFPKKSDEEKKEIVSKPKISTEQLDPKTCVEEAKSTDLLFVPSLDEENPTGDLKVNINITSLKEMPKNILSKLQARKVEDLLAFAWNLTNPTEHSGNLSVSEGRIYELRDGVLDNLEIKDEFLVDLDQYTLSLQSQMLSRINEKLLPVDSVRNSKDSTTTYCLLPKIIYNTDILLLVDINSSMTKLDEKKRIAAVILCSVIMSFSLYGVRIFSYVFGERNAIWRLFGFSETDVKTQLLRIIDALRVGNRPGSYLLDAIMTAQDGLLIK
jgi:hypothetical protein